MSLAKAAQRCVESLEHELQRVKYSLRRQGFSYSSEERILSKYIAGLLPHNHSRTVVDIGAGNGVRWSNTYSLLQKGWKGVGIEADGEKFSRLVRAYKNFPQAATGQIAKRNSPQILIWKRCMHLGPTREQNF